MTPKEAKTKHDQDEAWASLCEWKSHIERIALGGLTSSENDDRCIRKVFLYILAEMYMKETENDTT